MKNVHFILFIIAGLLLWSCHQAPASSSLRIQHPDDESKQIEYFVERPAGKGPWPAIVLLHGHQEGVRLGGRDFVEWGALKELSKRGYLAVAISQPGYGNSSGPADFAGVFTQHAVTAVIAKLRADELASPDRLFIEGISRGALTAGLVAAHDQVVTGLILISGVYDLPAYVSDSQASANKQAVVRSIMAETGGSVDALESRSILPLAANIKASTLIPNGGKDDRTDPGQARALADQITRNGGRARAIIYLEFGHQIPVEIRNKDVDPFIEATRGLQPF